MVPCGCRGSTRALVFVVVTPSDEVTYRERWPAALFLVLPLAGECLGAGYARYIIQKVCTAGQISTPSVDSFQPLVNWALPYAHILDDSLSEFFELRDLTTAEKQEANRFNGGTCMVHTKRVHVVNSFRKAMMSLQCEPNMRSLWVQGYSRDDGLCCTKAEKHIFGCSVYKAVLLNFDVLLREQVF